MVKLTINQQEIEVAPGTTILQACEQQGVEVPHFCYHPRLSIAGNCRMCLVEVEGAPKLVASCAMPVSENMVVVTDSPKVEKGREGVLEFLLINHPLDCPICDQGGECDLQDLTLNYGRGESRFDLNKRAVPNKYMGPLIKTVMTRCIHCTRCVRFAKEIAGVPELGMVFRGEHAEITTYLEETFDSELSANVIDICPVGALTSRPYAFKGRPWELSKHESIDVLDAVGSNIRIDVRGNEIMRILPRLNEEINEEWISDKTRYAFDGLKCQRLDRPYARKNGRLVPVSWDEAFDILRNVLSFARSTEIAAIAGDMADCESMLLLKELMQSMGVPHMDCRQDGSVLDNHFRSSYLFNTTIAGIEQADACLLIATNPRHEGAMINARLRKRYLKGGFNVGLVGPEVLLNYPYDHIGADARVIKDLISGKHPFAKVLASAKNPMLILGQAALNRRDSLEILDAAQKIARAYNMLRPDWNGFNVLHTAASRVGGLDLGFVPGKGGYSTQQILQASQQNQIRVLFLLGADEISMSDLGDTFVVYQGHHGDRGAHRADLILPGAAYTEKDGTYVNTEGRPQQAYAVVAPPGEAKEDWKILRMLSEHIDKPMTYSTLDDVREKLRQVNPIFGAINHITPTSWHDLDKHTPETLSLIPFKLPIDNFYMTDPISRHSPTMASCVAGEPIQRSVAHG